jgi:hypothetical protein
MRAILSASNLSAAALCPGKPNMERPFLDRTTIDAARGTALHPYFQSDLPRAALTADDREFMEYSDTLSRRFLDEFRALNGITDEEPFTRENEISLDGLVPGHPDAVYSWRDGAIVAILDLKTGPVEVDSADENEQLAAYSALVWQRKPFEVAGVCIVQPGCFGKHTSSAIYRAEQMSGVLDYIERIHAATVPEDAPRVAGEKQCRFCRARVACDAYTSSLMEIELLKVHAVSTANNDQLARLKRATQFADKVKDEINEELRKRIEAGEMPGWKLRNTGSARDLFDSTGAFLALKQWLAEQGHTVITASAYDNCRRITWEPIEKLFAEAAGMSQKKAKDTLKELLAPFVVETEKAKSPVEEK